MIERMHAHTEKKQLLYASYLFQEGGGGLLALTLASSPDPELSNETGNN